MKISGTAELNAPVDAVWSALTDPAVLVRTIPGCEQLEQTGPDAYRMTVTAGVASIKGTYQGEVALHDRQPPSSFLLRASGAGAPGTVSADVTVNLADAGDGRTRLAYDADAVVGGMIGGVGQRMLSGVAKKTAGEFFRNVDDVLTGKAVAEAPAAAAGAGAGGVPAGVPAEAGAAAVAGPAVFRAPQRAVGAVGVPGGDFTKGAVFGAVVALLGAVVGGWVAGRRA